MVKVTKKHASGGQGINPLDPRFVTVMDQGSITVTVNVCLATFSKGGLPAGPPEASLTRQGNSGIVLKRAHLFFAGALNRPIQVFHIQVTAMILMIDNFDSFTYNLVQYLEMGGAEVSVYRNNAVTVDEIRALAPNGIVISPGPGRPSSAGVSMETIKAFSGEIPILGVCLGHQSIAEAFGGTIVHAKAVMHGKVSLVETDTHGVFTGIASPMKAMRYHSLAVEEASLPAELIVTARTHDGEIMGLRHREHPTEGIQFHPESIMTTTGKRLIRNFIERT